MSESSRQVIAHALLVLVDGVAEHWVFTGVRDLHHFSLVMLHVFFEIVRRYGDAVDLVRLDLLLFKPVESSGTTEAVAYVLAARAGREHVQATIDLVLRGQLGR